MTQTLFLLRFALLLWSTGIFWNNLQAQTVTYATAKKKLAELYDRAGTAHAMGNYTDAEKILQEAIRQEPNFVDAWWSLGKLYLDQFNDPQKAIQACKMVTQLDAEHYELATLNLALAYLSIAQYDSALYFAKLFQAMPKVPASFKEKAIRVEKSCLFAQSAIQHPVSYTPRNLGSALNSSEDEFFPAVTADGRFLYFTRRTGIGRSADENIWVAEQQNGKWSPARPLEGLINSPDFQEGAHSISPSGKYLFFTRCGGPNGCDIYFSRKTGNTWDPPKNMGNRINTPGWESQPYMAADGITLYFSSTRRGGHGGADLWVTVLDTQSVWSEPVNLGPAINTKGDEMRPYLHPDNQNLYFSSNGHDGMGQSDLFLSRRGAFGEWGKPVNLGYPINTSGDERGIYLDASGKTAYLASSQRSDGLGGEDLYTFSMPESIQPAYVNYVIGTIRDKATKAPLSALIRIIDLSNGKVMGNLTSDDKTGEYLLTLPPGKAYAFHVTRDGYLLQSEHFTIEQSNGKEPQRLEILLSKIKTGDVVVLNNIFFETNQYKLRPESLVELKTLQNLLEKNPGLKIKICGHTDNTGKADWNKQLSSDRAKAVYDFLCAKGIDAGRLSYEGFGALKPVADNTTEAGKARNRRTEFVVTGQ